MIYNNVYYVFPCMGKAWNTKIILYIMAEIVLISQWYQNNEMLCVHGWRWDSMISQWYQNNVMLCVHGWRWDSIIL